MLTGHGKLRAYYHRFNIIDEERMQLRDIITKNGDRWPLNKSQIIRKYQSKFRTFLSAMDFKGNQPVVIS